MWEEEEIDFPDDFLASAAPVEDGGHASANPPVEDEDQTDTPRALLSVEAQSRTKPRSREMRVRALQMLKTHTYAYVCKQIGISHQTLYLWKKQMIHERTLEPRGHKGRPRTLSPVQTQEVAALLWQDPTMSNDRIVAHLGASIHPSTISRYTKRLGITRKKISDDEVLLIDERVIEECRAFYEKIRTIPWERRVYMDESFIYDNEAPSTGRAPRGKRIFRARARHGKKWTIYFAIRHNDMVHPPIMRKENASDAEFLAYVRDDLVPNLRAGDVVLWDRLGKSGRCKNPKKQHFNPACLRLIEEAGASLMFLPPKGKYFNPIELSFGTLKGHIRRSYSSSPAAAEKRPRTEEELREALEFATGMFRPEVLTGYFRERADGRGFQEAFPDVWVIVTN